MEIEIFLIKLTRFYLINDSSYFIFFDPLLYVWSISGEDINVRESIKNSIKVFLNGMINYLRFKMNESANLNRKKSEIKIKNAETSEKNYEIIKENVWRIAMLPL